MTIGQGPRGCDASGDFSHREVPMQTVVEPLGDEDLSLSELLDAIDQVGERVGELSLPELRSRIDEVHVFLVERLIPHLRAEARGLDEKLLALRERLVYSYFGIAEIRSLRSVLYDLYAIFRLHMAIEENAAEVMGPSLHPYGFATRG